MICKACRKGRLKSGAQQQWDARRIRSAEIWGGILRVMAPLYSMTTRSQGQKQQDWDKAFGWMWLTIVLSFGFYIPVVLWADAVPLIGMLMIPKTCAYVWTVLIGYSAKFDVRKRYGYLPGKRQSLQGPM